MPESRALRSDAPAPPSTRDRRVDALCVIFVVSGVCGLIYESIWSHYLKLFVGHAAYAQTVVLVVFIGGMALGAAIVGRVAGRIRSPLLAYAFVEALVGVISLVFHQLFVASTEWAYAYLLPAACAPENPCIAQWLFAALLILPQSILLGTTFPLMTGGILRLAPRDPGRRIALLYFLNSIGAAVGVLLAGFLLIPALGLPGTLLTAGLLNILVAFAAWSCAKGAVTESAKPSSTLAAVDPPLLRRILIVVAALTGLSSFVYEIIWIRMLSLVVGTSTHAFELMLAAFIFGLAMGGLWVRKRIDRFQNLIVTLAVVQVLMGIAAVATLALYDGMFDFMAWLFTVIRRGEAGYVVFNVVNHALALIVMLPATFLAGMTLPLITTALMRGTQGERAIGYTYAANTLGAIIGVIIAVHFALPYFGIKGGLLFGAAIDVALGVALLVFFDDKARTGVAVRWGATGVAALVIISVAVPVIPERLASGVYRGGRAKLTSEYQIPFHRDGKTASVTISQTKTYTTISTNGKPDAAIGRDGHQATADESTMVLTGLIPLAVKPDVRKAAVIGFGSGMTTATLLASPAITRVDTIEIEPQMVEAARYFGNVVAPAYNDPRSRIVIDDAKSYFARSRERYDLIVSEPSNPWVSGVASLFTQEFYARVKRQLEPGGVFAQWIQVYEFNDRLFATILRALDSEFADYTIYAANDSDLIIVASPVTLPPDLDNVVVSWPGLGPLLDRIEVKSADEMRLRRLASRKSIKPLLAVLGDGVNSDYYPIVDQLAPAARFAGGSATGLVRLAGAQVPILEMTGDGGPQVAAAASRPLFAPSRRVQVASAADAALFIRTGAATASGTGFVELALLRSVLWNCASLPSWIALKDLMLPVAGVVNPSLDASQAVPVWQAVRSARCANRLDASDLAWLDLFEAVAARDAAQMAKLGTQLAAGEAQEAFRLYATMAAATGFIATNRRDEASRLLNAMAPKLGISGNDPVLRFLAVLARSGPPPDAIAVR